MGQQFFDINKLKPWNGLLRFPISLSRIANAQSAKMYFETYIPHISPSKILTPTIWANFCYSDMLYMYSDQPATTLKKKYMSEICKHKNESKKYLGKPQKHLWKTPKDASYYISNSFSFDSWTSLYLWYEWDFPFMLKRLYDIYQNDSVFQKYLEVDCKDSDKLITNDQVMFFFGRASHDVFDIYDENIPHKFVCTKLWLDITMLSWQTFEAPDIYFSARFFWARYKSQRICW